MLDRPPDVQRIVSLDQFRGYTILGMFLVNFVGSYAAVKGVMPVLGHHHTYCSYADTIMPHFLFAVGFAFRLTLLRRRERLGTAAAYRHTLARNASLLLVAFIIHQLGSGWPSWSELQAAWPWGVLEQWGKRDFFQTLTHIAVTSLWVLPVIAGRPRTRLAYIGISAVTHLGLSYWFNYRWVNTSPNGIDGGPLGFLTWTIPLLAGSLAYDIWMTAPHRRAAAGRLLGWGMLLMVFAYFLSCWHWHPADMDEWQFQVRFRPVAPPLVHVDAQSPTNDLLAMSQRSGSVSYLVFGAGISLALYALFVVACDVAGWKVGVLRTLGTNALAAYVLHELVNAAVKPFVPRDSPLWYVALGFAASLTICYLLLRGMERQNLYLKL